MSNFNQNSPDALFATIIERLNQQDAASLQRDATSLTRHTEILTITKDHDERLGKLEKDKIKRAGFLAGVSVACGGVGHKLAEFFSGTPPSHH